MHALKKITLAAILNVNFLILALSEQSQDFQASAAVPAAPTLSLLASSGAQPPGGLIDVQVLIAGATVLAAFESDLILDQTIVQVEDINIEPLQGETSGCDPAVSRCASPLGPLPAGDVSSWGGYSYGNGPGTATAGTLATLHLATTGITGTSSINLANARLVDGDGILIEPQVASTSLTLADSQRLLRDHDSCLAFWCLLCR